mmetsp:Transcript_40779/g.66931  ORF Transcript_40779/g.66931 Transcript_40779/m.66931 type:complete len:237 (-) Transcript_40779:1215-1925(-)
MVGGVIVGGDIVVGRGGVGGSIGGGGGAIGGGGGGAICGGAVVILPLLPPMGPIPNGSDNDGGDGAIDGGAGAGGGMTVLLLVLLFPPIGPIPNGSDDRIAELKDELLADVGGDNAVSATGIKSSHAEMFELLFPMAMIGFRCAFAAFGTLLGGTTPANNPAAICILRDFSSCASSFHSGWRVPRTSPMAPVPGAPPMAPMVDTSFSMPVKLRVVEDGCGEEVDGLPPATVGLLLA